MSGLSEQRLTPIGYDLDLLLDAARFVIGHQHAGRTTLQRNIRVGFVKAGWLLNLLEERAIVGPAYGTFAREVLVPRDRLESVLASIRAEAEAEP